MTGRNTVRTWLECRTGSASIEFLLVAMILFVFVAGIIEFAGIMVANVLIEAGLREASRAGITGFVPNGMTREQYIMQVLRTHTQGLIDMTNATIETLVYPAFNSVGEPEPFSDANGDGAFNPGEGFTDVNGNGQWDQDMGQAGLGGPGDIVLYRLTYDWPLLTGLLDSVVGTGGVLRLTGSIVVRNEPQ